jgi:hypothetical protein
MTEIVTHTALTKNSPPFSLVGGSTYQIVLTGTIADGADSPEFQQFSNGNFVSLDPPVRYRKGEEGGCRRTTTLPAGSYRWSVPGTGHSVNTRVLAG